MRLAPGAVDGGGYETVDDGALLACGFGVSSGSGGRGLELTYRWNATSRVKIGARGTDSDMACCGEEYVVDFVISSYRNSIAAPAGWQAE